MSTLTSASVRVGVSAPLTKTVGSVTSNAVIELAKTLAYSAGIAVGQADRIYYAQPTIAASGTLSIDLSGTLVDLLGDPVIFAKVKAVVVIAAVANTNNVNVTRPANGLAGWFLAASDGIAVPPGGVFVWGGSGGVGVVASTGDLIDILNSGAGTSVTFDIAVIGTSA